MDLPGAHLFLDAFEDDDVRVGRDAEREDEAREARQRQRDVEDEDRRVQEGRVDREADDRDETEEAVEDEQEDRDEDRARRSPPSMPPASESLPSVAEMSVRSSVSNFTGQRAGLEHERDLLRLLERVEALDLRATAADAAATGSSR